MKLRLTLYSETGYQEDGANMPIHVYQVELESDSGDRLYTIGRIFFSPEITEELGREATLEVQDWLDLDEEASKWLRMMTPPLPESTEESTLS